jgi:hypothetical protein
MNTDTIEVLQDLQMWLVNEMDEPEVVNNAMGFIVLLKVLLHIQHIIDED